MMCISQNSQQLQQYLQPLCTLRTTSTGVYLPQLLGGGELWSSYEEGLNIYL